MHSRRSPGVSCDSAWDKTTARPVLGGSGHYSLHKHSSGQQMKADKRDSESRSPTMAPLGNAMPFGAPNRSN